MRLRNSSRASPARCTSWKGSMTALAPRVRLGGQPGFEDPLGSARGHVQEPRGATAIVDGRQIQDDGDVPVPMRGVAPHVSTLWALVAAHAHMQDRGAPPVGLMRQAPDYRAARNALAPAASTPLVLTSNTARQHCMVWLRCADSSPPTPDHQGA